MAEIVGLFGGSFNPIHFGHLVTARAIAEALSLSRLCFIPCVCPPHKWPHELATMDHRLQMARLAVAGEDPFDVSDVEAREDRVHYPIHAIELLRDEIGHAARMYWIIGCDAVSELWNWHRLADMLDLCEIVISSRAGVPMPDLTALGQSLTPAQIRRLQREPIATPHIEISATRIRQRVRERRSIRFLVPEPVFDYIEDWGLYQPHGAPGE